MKKLIILIALFSIMNSFLFAQFNIWVDAGNMHYPRVDHTSTLLPDGKVLIVGGMNSLQHAELYDPNSDSFSETGNTIKIHSQGSTATLLNNGKVLIVGGVDAQQYAELYDPTTENFELIDTLNEVHCYHTATLLNDGRVLIAGGQNNTGPQTHAVCEIYDPLTNKFTLTIDSLNEDRSGHRAVLLPDGRVLILGGIQTTTPGSGIYLNSCEMFDPSSGKFARTQDLHQPRSGLDATLLQNGKVLVTCGAWYSRYGEIFDPATETWSLTSDMMVMRRSNHTATILHNGKILLAGGFIDSATPTAEIYNPITNTFTAIDSMKVPRMQHQTTKLNDGSVLVTGGYDGATTLNSTERYLVDTSDVVSIREVNNTHGRIPADYQLFQNYPNPFNPSTKIRYAIPHLGGDESMSDFGGGSLVTLKVYDVLGNEIANLVNDYKTTGVYEVVFDASNLPSGLYFYRLQSSSFEETKKMILLR